MTFVLVITALIVFVAVQTIRIHVMQRARGADRVGAPVQAFSDIRLPQGLFLSDCHSWARLTEQGDLRVGMDELLAQAIGGVDSVELPKVGERVEAGAPLATVRRGGRSLTINSPVTGAVVMHNTAIGRSGSAVDADPYGAGWIAAVWPEDFQSSLPRFKVGARAVSWLRSETQRFCDFMAARSAPEKIGAVLADGARPVVGAAQSLDDEAWADFESAFAKERGPDRRTWRLSNGG